MNCISSRCLPGCEVKCPEPCAYSRGLGPCVASCGDSTALVYAPPVWITFPGPILSSCPQESIVASTMPQPSGPSPSYGSYSSGMGSSSGGLSRIGGSYGSGGSYGYGGSYGSGGSYGYGSSSRSVSGKGVSSGCGGSSSGGCYLRKFYASGSRGSRLGN